MKLWRTRTVESRLGWPVPRIAKAASASEISILVDTAEGSGFSRKGKGLVIHDGWRYYLLPYLREPSPRASWMCVVAAFRGAEEAAEGGRVEVRYARLDVAIEDFRKLPDAHAAERDQLLHWILWDAARSSAG